MNAFTPSYFFDLTDFEQSGIFDGAHYVWEPLTKIRAYLDALSLGKIHAKIPKGVHLENEDKIFIGEGTVIEPGAFIRGPCWIGNNCSIRHGAYIRGDFISGNGCVIGHDTEIKNAIFLNRAHAAHFAYVGDSILGNDVNLGAGTKCANLKFDSSPILIRFESKKINTQLKKFGAIFGDKSQTGCNSVTNPGTLFGKNAICYPCTNPSGFIPENHVVRPTHQLEVRIR